MRMLPVAYQSSLPLLLALRRITRETPRPTAPWSGVLLDGRQRHRGSKLPRELSPAGKRGGLGLNDSEVCQQLDGNPREEAKHPD